MTYSKKNIKHDLVEHQISWTTEDGLYRILEEAGTYAVFRRCSKGWEPTGITSVSLDGVLAKLNQKLSGGDK